MFGAPWFALERQYLTSKRVSLKQYKKTAL